MPRRTHQILLVLSLLWLSWLTMMLAHEVGHVVGAWVTGGTVQRIVWHPAVISRTDVWPNPHPLVELWAGPIVGCVLPLAVAALASLARVRVAYLTWVIAGFCLIANGAYIGLGALDPIGDAKEMVAQGMPRWPMVVFGVVTVATGFWIWHRVSPKLGSGAAPAPINPKHAYLTMVIAALMTVIGLVFGDRGV